MPENKEYNKSQKEKPALNYAEIGKYLSLVYQIGFTIIVSIAFFGFIGHLLDNWLDTKFIFTLVGIIWGILGSMYLIYKTIINMEK